MKQVEVQIMGHSYLLACPEGGEDKLHAAVKRVDEAMCRIRDAGKVRARDRIAVLAALNLAFDLYDKPAAPPPLPATASNAATPGTDRDNAALDSLLKRLDQALGKDGQLQ
ncbi:MAG: cell division protein ZapA [Rhodoferax sp.]|nr:cell division protein ZapA [Rhodoferax sp.]